MSDARRERNLVCPCYLAQQLDPECPWHGRKDRETTLESARESRPWTPTTLPGTFYRSSKANGLCDECGDPWKKHQGASCVSLRAGDAPPRGGQP